MVQVMPSAIGLQVHAERRGAEPGPDPGVEAPLPEEQPVRGLVHEHHEAELAGADDHDGHGQRERRRPEQVERDRARDDGPRVQDHHHAAQGGGTPEVPQRLERQQVTGRDRAVGGQGHARMISPA
jgi:hypothetical protein